MENKLQIKDLETLKEKCFEDLFDIASNCNLREKYGLVKVRFIDLNDEFGYTSFGRFFFVDDCMYLITKDPKYEEDHNPDILDFDDRLDILNYLDFYIVRVLFAGIYTGFNDNRGERIFTGDIISACLDINRDEPIDKYDIENRYRMVAGVASIFSVFSLILDNHSAALYKNTYMERIGTVFFDLDKSYTEYHILGLCNVFAQHRGDRDKLINKSKNTPSFLP
ncbi:MAG: hypothetical protein WC135_08725 [Bacteroidales bacterium]